jgi:hypothetical protein
LTPLRPASRAVLLAPPRLGSSDSSSGGKGEFAGGKVDPVEAGKKGGNSSN